MSRRHIATALVVCGAFLTAPHALPAQADTPDRAVAPSRAAVKPLIQGVVVDQAGRYVDDVKVQALDEDGDVVATALTYASAWPDGKQHGYFFVEVPRGTYTVELSKKGYKTVEYDAGRITKKVKKISLGEIEITKVGAPSTTTAAPVKATVTTKDVASVTVTVRSSGADKPTGRVEIRSGRKVLGDAVINKRDKGTVVVSLGKLAKGTYDLKAFYLGSADAKSSSSSAFTLTVVKKKR